jgi:hypothetical protein
MSPLAGAAAVAEPVVAVCAVGIGIAAVAVALTACDGAAFVVVVPAALSLLAATGEAIAIRRGEMAMVSADTSAGAAGPWPDGALFLPVLAPVLAVACVAVLAASDGTAASAVDAAGGNGAPGAGAFDCATLMIGPAMSAPAVGIVARATDCVVTVADGCVGRGDGAGLAASAPWVRAALSSAIVMRAAKLGVPSRRLRAEAATFVPVVSAADDCVSLANPTAAGVALPGVALAGTTELGAVEPETAAGVAEIGAGETMNGSQQSAPSALQGPCRRLSSASLQSARSGSSSGDRGPGTICRSVAVRARQRLPGARSATGSLAMKSAGFEYRRSWHGSCDRALRSQYGAMIRCPCSVP